MAETVTSQLVNDICGRVEHEPEVVGRNRRRWKFNTESSLELEVRANGRGDTIVALCIWDPSELKPGDHVHDATTAFNFELLEEGGESRPDRVQMHYNALVTVAAGIIKLCLAKT